MSTSRVASWIAIVGGSLVLLGWAMDIRILIQPLPTVASMKPNAAAAFVLLGMALRQLAAARGSRWGSVCAAAVLVLGVVTLSQDVFGRDFGIDQALFADSSTVATSSPGRMAPATAFCFSTLGLAIIASRRRRHPWLAHSLSLVVAFVSATAIVGYLYGVRALYGIGPFTTMAAHTALLLFVLAAGVIFVQAHSGLMEPILNNRLEGRLARRILLPAIGIQVLLGWLRLMGQRAGWYDTEFGLALMVLSTIVSLSVVVWLNARSLGQSDYGRRTAEIALQDLNNVLARRVEEQTRGLARREVELRVVIENAHDAFVALDQRGHVVEWNPQAAETFGWSRSELMGVEAWSILVPERFRESYRTALNGFMDTGKGPLLDRRIETTGLHRDGRELPVELTVSPVQFDDGWRFNAFIRDVTTAKKAEREIRRSLTEKEALLKEVHHRVKNNMQIISSFLRLQARKMRDPVALRALRESEERVLSMALLHENLYRSDDLGQVDFPKYLRTLTAELLSTYAGGRGNITIVTDAAVSALELDQAVPAGLLINELVTNALKHGFPAGRAGRISVALKSTGTMATLTVFDDGVGMPEGIEHQKTDSLGLEIVDALSRQLRGRYAFTRDGGTRFELEFPLRGE